MRKIKSLVGGRLVGVSESASSIELPEGVERLGASGWVFTLGLGDTTAMVSLTDDHLVLGTSRGYLLFLTGRNRVWQCYARAADAHAGHVSALEFLPSQAMLVSGANDRLIKMWVRSGPMTWALSHAIRAHEESITRLLHLSNGVTLASVASDGTMQMLRLAGRRWCSDQLVKVHDGSVLDLDERDGLLVTCSSDGLFKAWRETESHWDCFWVSPEPRASVRAVHLVSEHDLLVGAADQLEHWTLTGKGFRCLRAFPSLLGEPRRIVGLSKELFLVANSVGATLWRTSEIGFSIKAVSLWQGMAPSVPVVASRTGVYWASVLKHGKNSMRLSFWEVPKVLAERPVLPVPPVEEPESTKHSILRHEGAVTAMCWHAKQCKLLVATANLSIMVWRSADGEFEPGDTLPAITSPCLRMVDTGHGVVMSFHDCSLQLWVSSPDNFELVARVEGLRDVPTALVMLNAKRFAATVGRALEVWNIGSRDLNCAHSFSEHTGKINDMALRSNGVLVTVARDRTFKWWHPQDDGQYRLAHSMDHASDFIVTTVVALPDDSLAAACSDGQVRIWVLGGRYWRVSVVIPGFLGRRQTLIATPNGSLVFTGGSDLWVWQRPGGFWVSTAHLQGHLSGIESLSVVNDHRLISASTDGEVRSWQLPYVASNHFGSISDDSGSKHDSTGDRLTIDLGDPWARAEHMVQTDPLAAITFLNGALSKTPTKGQGYLLRARAYEVFAHSVSGDERVHALCKAKDDYTKALELEASLGEAEDGLAWVEMQLSAEHLKGSSAKEGGAVEYDEGGGGDGGGGGGGGGGTPEPGEAERQVVGELLSCDYVSREEASWFFHLASTAVRHEEVSHAVTTNLLSEKERLEQAWISANPKLKAYYDMLITTFSTHYHAAATIASGLVMNARVEKGTELTSNLMLTLESLDLIPIVNIVSRATRVAMQESMKVVEDYRIGRLVDVTHNAGGQADTDIELAARHLTMAHRIHILGLPEDESPEWLKIMARWYRKAKAMVIYNAVSKDEELIPFRSLGVADANILLAGVMSGTLSQETFCSKDPMALALKFSTLKGGMLSQLIRLIYTFSVRRTKRVLAAPMGVGELKSGLGEFGGEREDALKRLLQLERLGWEAAQSERVSDQLSTFERRLQDQWERRWSLRNESDERMAARQASLEEQMEIFGSRIEELRAALKVQEEQYCKRAEVGALEAKVRELALQVSEMQEVITGLSAALEAKLETVDRALETHKLEVAHMHQEVTMRDRVMLEERLEACVTHDKLHAFSQAARAARLEALEKVSDIYGKISRMCEGEERHRSRIQEQISERIEAILVERMSEISDSLSRRFVLSEDLVKALEAVSGARRTNDERLQEQYQTLKRELMRAQEEVEQRLREMLATKADRRAMRTLLAGLGVEDEELSGGEWLAKFRAYGTLAPAEVVKLRHDYGTLFGRIRALEARVAADDVPSVASSESRRRRLMSLMRASGGGKR